MEKFFFSSSKSKLWCDSAHKSELLFCGLSLKWLGITISKLFEIMNTIFGNLTHPWLFLTTFSLLSTIDVTDITYFILKLRRNIRNTINFSLMLVVLKAKNLYSLLLCYTYIDLLLHVYESMETSKSFSISQIRKYLFTKIGVSTTSNNTKNSKYI